MCDGLKASSLRLVIRRQNNNVEIIKATTQHANTYTRIGEKNICILYLYIN